MPRSKESGEIVLAVAATAPSMVLRLGISYLRYKLRAKDAGKVFFRSLVANGIPEREARELADEYTSAFSLRMLVRRFT